MGNTVSCGICHSFAADGRCISLLKILFTNECIFDCKYCINRRSNDTVRASFTPDEVCTLTMEFYRRNYIEGLFLSSGILHSPTHTMTLLLETVKKLRTLHNFNGYIHLKGIPGADASVIEEAGWYVDRMSINLELPTSEGLKSMAPNKTRKNILTPMRQIQNGIINNKLLLTDGQGASDIYIPPNNIELNEWTAKETSSNSFSSNNTVRRTYSPTAASQSTLKPYITGSDTDYGNNVPAPGTPKRNFITPLNNNIPAWGQHFVPAGQSTQMIIGATPENDFQIVSVAEALYNNYSLKRVFYSAFINVNNDSTLPSTLNGPPLLREHRLYQADWLLRFYGFKANELLSEDKPHFNTLIDPKCDWALRHLEHFPVEINKASKHTLLRVPGMGPKSVERIIRARRTCRLDFEDIRKMGVVMKRARYFITCNGRMEQNYTISEDYITSQLIGVERRKVLQLSESNIYHQISFFDDNNENFTPLTLP